MCDHSWQLTGKHGIHVEFPTKTEGKRQLYAFYVRCVHCRQLGFRRHPDAALVYTWAKEDASSECE